MRTDHVTLGPGSWFARGIVVTLFLLSGAALAPRAAKADITYTWVDDLGQGFTGSMAVLGTAQAAGQIKLTDVTSFAFTTPIDTTVPNELFPQDFPLSISTTTAAPTGTTTMIESSTHTSDRLSVAFDTNWNILSGEKIVAINAFGITEDSDLGHWSITAHTTTSVPEPSTAVVAVIGAVAFIAYGWSRHRREQRRQAAA